MPRATAQPSPPTLWMPQATAQPSPPTPLIATGDASSTFTDGSDGSDGSLSTAGSTAAGTNAGTNPGWTAPGSHRCSLSWMLSSVAFAQPSRGPPVLGITAERPTGSRWRGGPKREWTGRWERAKGMRV